jgi:aspartyl-tRNA(Asn)/glutamyl-tRNA(Gln) amidotransferase subunit A
VRDMAIAERRRTEMQMTFVSLFERIDVLLTPTVASYAFDATLSNPTVVNGLTMPDGPELTAIFNLTGASAISVPAGFAHGLPVGLQIVGPRFSDALVLQVARAVEQLQPWPLVAPWPPPSARLTC